MKRFAVGLIGWMALCSGALVPQGGAAFAQSVADPRIATLDMLVVEKEALAFQDLLAKYQEANASFDRSARQSDQDLRQEATTLQNQRTILSIDAFNQRVSEYKERERLLNEEFSKRKSDIERARLSAAEQIKAVMREILTEMAKEQGLNLVLNSSNLNPGQGAVILLSSEEIDITKQMIGALNERIKAISFAVN